MGVRAPRARCMKPASFRSAATCIRTSRVRVEQESPVVDPASPLLRWDWTAGLSAELPKSSLGFFLP